MPDWKSVETYKRLIAAMLAAQGHKPDYRKIATYFGDNTTYDSIEGRFRPLRKLAETLKEEVESSTRTSTNNTTSTSFTSNASDATPKKPRAKKVAANGTPTPKKEKVINGRVTKSGGPNKGAKNPLGLDGSSENGSGKVVNGIKEELVSSGASSFFGGEEDAVGDVDVDVPMGTGWEFSDIDAMSAYVMGGGVEGI
ncbi:hypothetical protein G7Y79_00001g003680 [Physcia stellaris]|nr:hypothetical protein G7Y79_00001g003680 [Physcia stellaris]